MVDRDWIEARTCFHPEAPRGCGKIIRAHTLQRSGIIQQLVGPDNHVCSFYPIRPASDGNPVIHRVGWHQASTFFGFCDSHDNTFFSAIETRPFTGSPDQILLVGYRALCHELYQKEALVRTDAVQRENLDRGLSEFGQRLIQDQLNVILAGAVAGLRELEDLKREYDRIYRLKDYGALHTIVLWFKGKASVASTSIVHVDFDLDENRLQNLNVDPAPMHGLTFGVVSTSDGCAFVAAWPALFQKCDDFMRSLMKRDKGDLPSLLTEFFFAYVENTYFSEAWWSGLPDPNKRRLMDLANIKVQYGSPFRYSGLRHVNWELAKTVVNWQPVF